MKKLLLYAIALVFLASCGSTKKELDKSAELNQLKQERTALDERIKKLEAEIAAESGNVLHGKQKLVTADTLYKKVFTHYVEIQAKVESEENILVTAQQPGIIKSVYVTEGQSVSKGQLLAEVDNEAARKNVETIKTQLQFARDLYTKQKALWDQHIGSEVQYLSAKNNMETLEASLAAANEQLEFSKFISPINGVVDAVDIKVGQIASPGMMGIRVVNMQNLKVKGEVSESHAASVQTGNKAIIYFPDLGREVESKISFTSKVINPGSRTFSTEAKIPSDGLYKPNMIAVLKIADYSNPEALLVDINLVQQAGEGAYIYIAEHQGDTWTAKRRSITTGKVYDSKIEVLSGLQEGDIIITQGYQELVNGQPVIM